MGLLEDKLCQLKHQGYCVLERWEILSKFPGRERITDTVWSSVREIYVDNYEDNGELRFIKCDDTTTTQKYVIFRIERANNIIS